MKNFITALIIFFMSINAFSQPTINPAYTVCTTTQYYFSWVSFINSVTGYVVDNSPSDPYKYYFKKTTNGGTTWSTSYLDGSRAQVIFFDEIYGISTNAITSSPSTIGKTTNGGLNWTPLGVTNLAQSITFINDSVGFFANAGGFQVGHNPNNQIYRTTDRGNTWSVILQGYNTDYTVFHNIEFINANTGFISGYAQHVTNPPTTVLDSTEYLKTTNGGTNWTKIFVPEPYTGNRLTTYGLLKFFNANTGYVQTYVNDQHYIMKTTNGGTNWNLQKDLGTTYFNYWQFLDTNKIWGYSLSYILKSSNAFETITKENVYDTLDTYTGGKIFNDGTAYILSNKWKKLYKTTVVTNIPVLISSQIPDKFNLSQNYPNPFNPSTKINYDLPFDSKVSIKIFDVTGIEVASLVNNVQVAGYYSVNFNASNLSSGVYFYRIETNNFIETKRMVLVK